MIKSEIVKKSAKPKTQLHLPWSCYRASDKGSGKCESCALRLIGLREAGVKDPISYEE